MISNELKEKKNLIAIFVFSIILFIVIKLNWYTSVGESIVTTLLLSSIIIIIFKSLKWILWKFLRPTKKDVKKVKKREKLTDKIASILVGSFMLLIITSQIMMSLIRINRSTPFQIKKTHSTDYSIETKTTNIHSDLNSCESLKSRFQSCVSRSYRGLECFPGTDIVLPKRCRY